MGRSVYVVSILMTFLVSCNISKTAIDIEKLDYERIILSADRYLEELPLTVTAYKCDRSEGGIHDFYSEGDYWWPDPENPEGPYIRRDGLTNPENFTAHRIAMRNFSQWVPCLVAAYKLTGDEKYADWALKHLKAWFVDENTRMTPSLLYSQAIKGRVSGRGIGIIDTIHLIEVVRAIECLKEMGYLNDIDFAGLSAWFESYLLWLTKHPYGIAERDHGNNHSAWWVAQVSAFSKLVGDKHQLDFCRRFYKQFVLPEQMDIEGRFTDELARTKPYSYSMFNLEAFSLICKILSTEEENLWEYTTEEGKTLRMAFDFMFPFLKDKTKWPYPPDVEHFDKLPIRGSALLFGGIAFKKQEYIDLWASLKADSETQELIRTFVIRQPLLWVSD